jgi:hypothetical protein
MVGLGSRAVDHYADAVFSEPGRCWRMVHDGEGSGRPTFCEEPVVWVGNTRLVGGKQIRVWSCQGHREGVEEIAPSSSEPISSRQRPR